MKGELIPLRLNALLGGVLFKNLLPFHQAHQRNPVNYTLRLLDFRFAVVGNKEYLRSLPLLFASETLTNLDLRVRRM